MAGTSLQSTALGFALLQLQRGAVVFEPEELSYAASWVVKAYYSLRLLMPLNNTCVAPHHLDFVLYYYYMSSSVRPEEQSGWTCVGETVVWLQHMQVQCIFTSTCKYIRTYVAVYVNYKCSQPAGSVIGACISYCMYMCCVWLCVLTCCVLLCLSAPLVLVCACPCTG